MINGWFLRPLAPKFNRAHCPGDDFEGGDDEVKEGSEDEMMGDEFPHDSDEEVVDETKVVVRSLLADFSVWKLRIYN